MINGIEVQIEFAPSERKSKSVFRIEERVRQETPKPPSTIEGKVWKLLAARCNFAEVMQEMQVSENELKKIIVVVKANMNNPRMSYAQLVEYAVKQYGEKT